MSIISYPNTTNADNFIERLIYHFEKVSFDAIITFPDPSSSFIAGMIAHKTNKPVICIHTSTSNNLQCLFSFDDMMTMDEEKSMSALLSDKVLIIVSSCIHESDITFISELIELLSKYNSKMAGLVSMKAAEIFSTDACQYLRAFDINGIALPLFLKLIVDTSHTAKTLFPFLVQNGPSHQNIIDVDVIQMDSNQPGEDRFCVRENAYARAYAVIDGHGGFLAADITMSCLLDIIVNNVSSISFPINKLTNEYCEKIVQLIDEAFIAVDQIILQKSVGIRRSEQQPVTTTTPLTAADTTRKEKSLIKNGTSAIEGKHGSRSGCCVSLVLIVGDMLFTAHVGDCRVVSVLQRSVPQTIAQDLPPQQEPLSQQQPHSAKKTKKKRDSTGKARPESSSKMSKADPSLEAIEAIPAPCPFDTVCTSDLLHQQLGVDGDVMSEETSVMTVQSINGIDHEMQVTVQELTQDHCCGSPADVQCLLRLSSDPSPCRPSQTDIARFGDKAMPRVAGSLAVTRALGDGYLKTALLSFPPYSQHLPYISCRPTVSYRRLRPGDSFVLASDGLWNYVSAKDCLQLQFSSSFVPPSPLDLLSVNSHVYPTDWPQGTETAGFVPAAALRIDRTSSFSRCSKASSPSSQLLDLCLHRAAAVLDVPAAVLRRMAVGAGRRAALDDITIMTLSVQQ